jgi:hypothetical protein
MKHTSTEALLRASIQMAKQRRLIAAQRAYIIVLREKLGERTQPTSMFHHKQAG